MHICLQSLWKCYKSHWAWFCFYNVAMKTSFSLKKISVSVLTIAQLIAYPSNTDKHSLFLKRFVKCCHLALTATSCSNIAHLSIFSHCFDEKEKEPKKKKKKKSRLLPSVALLTKKKSEIKCSEWSHQSHMVLNVQRTLITGNRKPACLQSCSLPYAYWIISRLVWWTDAI